MPAPLAKGIIIAASILCAAGIAFYENPQIRQWVDQSRRKLAIALHSLGDDIAPPPASRQDSEDETAQSDEQRRRYRQELLRRNRAELIRRARQEGVAVDLDQLAALGSSQIQERRNVNRSFDELVGNDGTLREQIELQDRGDANTTGADTTGSDSAVRHRGQGARGMSSGAAFANPFADEDMGDVLFDRDLIGAEQNDTAPAKTRESTATLQGDAPFIDLTGSSSSRAIPGAFENGNDDMDIDSDGFSQKELAAAIAASQEEASLLAIPDTPSTLEFSLSAPTNQAQPPPTIPPTAQESIERAMAESFFPHTLPDADANLSPDPEMSMIDSAASFHSFAEEPAVVDNEAADLDSEFDDDFAPTPTGSGTMTPTEDGSHISSPSEVGTERRTRSVLDVDMISIGSQSEAGENAGQGAAEARSDSGLGADGSHAAHSRAESRAESVVSESDGAYSVISGTDTPSSWSDVGSEAGTEDGMHA